MKFNKSCVLLSLTTVHFREAPSGPVDTYNVLYTHRYEGSNVAELAHCKNETARRQKPLVRSIMEGTEIKAFSS